MQEKAVEIRRMERHKEFKEIRGFNNGNAAAKPYPHGAQHQRDSPGSIFFDATKTRLDAPSVAEVILAG